MIYMCGCAVNIVAPNRLKLLQDVHPGEQERTYRLEQEYLPSGWIILTILGKYKNYFHEEGRMSCVAGYVLLMSKRCIVPIQ